MIVMDEDILDNFKGWGQAKRMKIYKQSSVKRLCMECWTMVN